MKITGKTAKLKRMSRI